MPHTKQVSAPSKPSLKEEIGYNVDSIVRAIMERHPLTKKLRGRIKSKVSSAFTKLTPLAEED